MFKSKFNKNKKIQQNSQDFSEVKEFNHEQNPVAKAQKQASSQETTGVLDQNQK